MQSQVTTESYEGCLRCIASVAARTYAEKRYQYLPSYKCPPNEVEKLDVPMDPSIAEVEEVYENNLIKMHVRRTLGYIFLGRG